MADVATQSKSSIELSRNASGNVAMTVKIYVCDPEEQVQADAQVDAAVATAKRVLGELQAAYPVVGKGAA